MVITTAMNYTLRILLLLLLHRLTLTYAAAADRPLALSSTVCSEELVVFSACLPYVAVFPNNLTGSPPRQCCDDVSAAFGNGSAICLCYFVRRPKILGFPLNSTKIMSLSSLCPLKDRKSKDNFSLETLCSGSAALPPLQSITGGSNSKPHNSVAYSPPPPLMGSPQESSSSPTAEPDNELTSQPSLSAIPTTISHGTHRIYRLSWTLLSSLLTVSHLCMSPPVDNHQQCHLV